VASEEEFKRSLADLRPKVHRYCARMTGSAIDGEDVVQEVFIKAVTARAAGTRIENFEGWLFRVAHNASLDFLRARARHPITELVEGLHDQPTPAPALDVATLGFRAFLALPMLQRCAVVLKDVLGYSIDEIATIADCTPAAAKSALQRGRARLGETAGREAADVAWPAPSGEERVRLLAYVTAFQSGDFESVRAMLADEVRLDLVNRLSLDGRGQVSPYFTRYAQATQWRYAIGAVEGRPAMLVYDSNQGPDRPAHFVIFDWADGAVRRIRDYLFAPYVMDGVEVVRSPDA
jgi:RNA polymerase sigma-70 factor (ECF subfamily)